MKVCYHTTSATAADSILSGGFLDNTEDHPLFGDIRGVFLGRMPLTDGVGLPIDAPPEKYERVLRVEFRDDFDLDGFLWDGQLDTWHIPAAVINEHASVTLWTDDGNNEEQR